MNKLKQVLAAIFGISSREYAGFKVIVFTAIICSVGLVIVNEISKSPYNNYEKDAEHLDSLLAIMKGGENQIVKNAEPIILKKFDPNSASEKDFMQMGIPSWLINRILNYRKAGGNFKQADDLLKIYNFPDSLYDQLENYIVIKSSNNSIFPLKAEKPISNQSALVIKREETFPAFDINKADTAMFQTIKGVGSKLSMRIVDYRDALGGFVSKNQLYEIYRLDSSVIEKLKKKGVIKEDFIPLKIEVNIEDKEQLAAHPYISWNRAKLIIAYRNQHGAFNSGQDLMEVYSINENWIKKIAPYLTFQKGSP